MESRQYLTLKDINQHMVNDKKIEIPSLQRGLVWTPKQVEFLWDSILRGFPVGGVVLSENKENYELMDGQQRFDSINKGFLEPIEDSEVIIWLDLRAQKFNGCTRKYFIKVTTKSHPWGYKNDENSSTLSANEKRLALELYGKPGLNIYNESFRLSDGYPYESKNSFPIPLAFFLNAELSTLESFEISVFSKLNALSDTWKKTFLKDENITYLKDNLEELRMIFNKALYEYFVPFSILNRIVVEKETEKEENPDIQSDLEVLFTRLNTNGTRITQTDLAYSAIKAYWGEIKDQNIRLSDGFIPSQTLVNLLFRLALTIKNKNEDKFDGFLSIRRIRRLAFDQEDFNYIVDFYKTKAAILVQRVKDSLCDIPPYIQMKMVSKKPDILLYLLFLSSKGVCNQNLKLSGLALFLFWFCNDITFSINLFYKETRLLEDDNDILIKIQHCVLSLIEMGKASIIYSPKEIRESVLCNGSILRKDYKKIPEFSFLYSIRNWDSCLIYAQKEYIKKTFSKYNPADLISWEDHNRPWDYDHIMPYHWSYNKLKSNKEKARVDYWLNTIGNKAAIPFEVNRSKSDNGGKESYQHYYDNEEDLLFDSRYATGLSVNVTRNEEEAILFENLCFQRLLKIYEKCFNSFSLYFNLEKSEKGRILELIAEKLCIKSKIVFVDGSYEYEVKKLIDYYRPNLSLEIDLNKECVLGFTWNGRDNYEIGLRKARDERTVSKEFYANNRSVIEEFAGKYNMSLVNKDWWYVYSHDVKRENACEKLISMYSELSCKLCD